MIEHDLGYYTRPDGVTIAYGTAGSGPPLIVVPGWTTHVSWWWREPATLLVEPLTRHFRLVVYDKHGHGLSDRDRTEFTLEAERYDVEALADHLGLEKFDLFGLSEGGAVAMSYAAHHPERVRKLALYSTFANGPAVASADFQASLAAIVRASWGVGSKVIADMLVPGSSAEEQEEFAASQREGASAEVAARTLEMLYSWDLRPELPRVSAPTIVIHRRDSRAFPPRHGRDIAAGIPDCRAVIVDGVTHFPPRPGDPNTIDVVNEILGFLGDGARVESVREQASIQTIVFTDVESSTELTDRLGDEAARQVLRVHERLTREALSAHGGTEVKTMGDGFMVSFSSASAALDAAIDLQRAIARELNDDDNAIRVRVGINSGEPIAEDDDLYGTAVIKAARIMAQADGGQILVSGLVRELVAGRDFPFTTRGRVELKGFEEPVLLHELHWEEGRHASHSEAALTALRERIGAEYVPGEWFTIDQDCIDSFADVTHDHQFIHVDPERAAAETPFGGTIAHGFLTLSLLSHLVESIPAPDPPFDGLTTIINYGLGRVRFVAPVPSGTRVRASSVIRSVEPKATAVHVTRTVTIEIEDVDKPALVAESIASLVYDS